MQTRSQSRKEAATQQTIGFIVAILSQLMIFPVFDIHINITDNLIIGLYFATMSCIRSYFVRRYFNKKHD
tara:strand:+ start:99 stop:308 length:210 start_codon:yes stop_codon:yes gene_type:complete